MQAIEANMASVFIKFTLTVDFLERVFYNKKNKIGIKKDVCFIVFFML